MTQNFSLRPLRGVLFDLDGTLLDTYDVIRTSFQRAMNTVFGHDVSMDAFNASIGRPLAVQLRAYADSPEQLEEIFEAYRKHDREVRASLLREFDGMRDVLDALKEQGYTLGVVTSKQTDSARDCLTRCNIIDYFSCVVGADQVVHPKPAADPILLGAKLCSLSVDECLYIGDSPYDIQAATAAHTQSIAVAWGQHPLPSLMTEKPTYVAEVPLDLIDRINEAALSRTSNNSVQEDSKDLVDGISQEVFEGVRR